MKAISIWQPYASLVVYGEKVNETRGWPAPKSLIGRRIAIASTKIVKPEQRAAFNEPLFQAHYLPLEWPTLDELYHGYVLGTAELFGCEPIDNELISEVSAQELAFGWYEPGRWAWNLRNPEPFDQPIRCSGAQGVWNWNEQAPQVTTLRTTDARPTETRENLQSSFGEVVLFRNAKAR